MQAPLPPVYLSRLQRVTASARYSTCGPTLPPIDYFWDVSLPADPAASAGSSSNVIILTALGPTLELSSATAGKLAAGKSYTFRVSARLRGFVGGHGPAVGFAEAQVTISQEPISARITGGGGTFGRTARASIDASSSFDPNDASCAAITSNSQVNACPLPSAKLLFSWACAVGPAGAPAAALERCRLRNWTLLKLPETASVVVDMGDLAVVAGYPVDVVLTVTVSTSEKTSVPHGTASTTIRVVDADMVPTRRLQILYINADGAAFLAAATTATSAKYSWSIAKAAASGVAEPLDTRDVVIFPTGSAGQTFLVRIDSPRAQAGLVRGITYRVTVAVTPGDGAVSAPAMLWVDFTPGVGPVKGICAAVSNYGLEYTTALVAECGGWVSEELPLTYSFAVLTSKKTASVSNSADRALDDAAMWAPWDFSSRWVDNTATTMHCSYGLNWT